MLLPKRVKYRRVHRGRLKGKATRGNTVTYGEFGLQATEPAWITSNQIEAARVMFEIAGVSEEVAREALRLASHKLPIKTKIVTKEETAPESENGGEA